MEVDLVAEMKEHVVLPKDRLQLYLSACKLLDTTVALPTDIIPHFQL